MFDENYMCPNPDVHHDHHHHHERPSYDLIEDMVRTKTDMKMAIERVKCLEEHWKTFVERTNCDIEIMENNMRKECQNLIPKFQQLIDSYNVTYSEAFAEYQRLLQTEINMFEASVHSKIDRLEGSVNDTINLFKTTWEDIITDRLNQQDEKVSNAVAYLRTNLGATVATMVGDMCDSGEMGDIALQAMNANAPLDYYNVTNAGVDIDNAVQYCKTNGKIFYVPTGKTLTITKTLDLRGVDVCVNGMIVQAFDGIGVIVGGDSASWSPRNVFINRVLPNDSATNENNIHVRVMGVMRGRIEIQYTDNIEIYADGDDETADSVAYNNFYIGKCKNFRITDKAGASKQGWINENAFFGLRCDTTFTMQGNSYKHNNNTFYKPCIEKCTVTINNCRRNLFLEARTEGAKITFDKDSSFNFVEANFLYDSMLPQSSVSHTDNGFNNVITNKSWEHYDTHPLYIMSADTINKGLYEIADTEGIEVDDDGVITFNKAYNQIIADKVLDVEHIKYMTLRSDGRAFRWYITPYDKNMNVLYDSNNMHKYIKIQGANAMQGEGQAFNTTNADFLHLVKMSNDVKYISMRLEGGEITGSTAAQPFTVMSITMHYEKVYAMNAHALGEKFKA